MFRIRLNMTRFHVIASVSVAINRVGIPRRLIATLAPLARNDKSPHFVILNAEREESQDVRIMRCFGYRLNMTRFHVIASKAKQSTVSSMR